MNGRRQEHAQDLPHQTVGDLLTLLFPKGTIIGEKSWNHCPALPSDTFAAAALLLERSGAYSAIRIGKPRKLEGGRAVLWLTPDDRNAAAGIGQCWLAVNRTPTEITGWWKQLWAARKLPIFVGPHESNAPIWWLIALKLLIASDEAARGAGFALQEGRWFAEILTFAAAQHAAMKRFTDSDDEYGDASTPLDGFWTIADRANPDVACVLPKSRTAGVGVTLRSLTHHLALLPPQGIVRTKWYMPQGTPPEEKAFNILLIPFPFRVDAKSFRAKMIPNDDKNIGWFDITQDWLRNEINSIKEFIEYITSLVEVAEQDVGTLHGIVFPELALNWRYYESLRTALITRFPNLELLVSGVGDYPVKNLANSPETNPQRILKKGNFAVTTCFANGSAALEFGRAKHHRWRIDHDQICRYGLGSALDPSRTWWENIDLTWRELEICVVRQSASVTSLICEDLARLDPSQIALRAIGPTIVFALLMDGPQLIWRWASRNATVLAEDPGSAVLTFTSMGLIDRINKSCNHDENRCVGLWRDDNGHQTELTLDRDCDAILLTLSSGWSREWTLDGRDDNNGAVRWVLSGHRSISTSRQRPGWIKPT